MQFQLVVIPVLVYVSALMSDYTNYTAKELRQLDLLHFITKLPVPLDTNYR